MKDLLVGSTGFVGGNLKISHAFFKECHSTNVGDYYGMNPDLCVYAGVPSTMFLANSNPDADLEIVKQALNNIHEISPKKLVLISTIAVYNRIKDVDENDAAVLEGLSAYGRNRAQLENWVREDYPDSVIVRLPALYGDGLKKNFLYDMHNLIPPMLRNDKYEELSRKSGLVKDSYKLFDNGFYKLMDRIDRTGLRLFFKKNDFNALSFTDSRSRYQFYSLKRLWDDICKILDNDLNLVNLVTPPVSASELYQIITGTQGWENHQSYYYDYDIKTEHSKNFGDIKDYICSLGDEIEDVVKFMKSWKSEEMLNETMY